MITTHSPVFIDVSKPHTTIIRVDKDEESKTRIFSTESANFDEGERKRLQMVRACNPSINEFFFANDIVLVEGETEQSVLTEIKKSNNKYINVQIVNCYGKANIPMFMKILNHFGVNYTVIHDVDSPYVTRKGIKIKNPMWTINEKIFELSGIKYDIKNMIIANMPDFEFQYFGYLQKGDKPYSALCKLKDPLFIATSQYKELINIFDDISSRKHRRSISNFSDYYQLLNEYVYTQNPEPKEHWIIEGIEKVHKESAVTKEDSDKLR